MIEGSSAIAQIALSAGIKQISKFYVSGLSRSKSTAKMLFPDMGFYEMPELGEVPLKSFMECRGHSQ